MRVRLIQPSIDTCYEYAASIGLRSMAQSLRNRHAVEVLEHSTLALRRSLAQVLASRADVVGISAQFTNGVPNCYAYARAVRRRYPETILVAGGNHATMCPEDLLQHGFDYVVRGEGELTFAELLDTLARGGDPRAVAGLAYRDEDRVVCTGERPLIADLDSLPWLDHDRFDSRWIHRGAGIRFHSIETSRGCPYTCSFCTTSAMWGKRYRHKSPARILKEFVDARRVGTEYLWLVDDDCGVDEEHLVETCRLLVKERVQVPWVGSLNSRGFRDPAAYRLLREAGCVKIYICIEAASDRLLQLYRKPFTVADNRRTSRHLREQGIIVHNHGIIGAPDETVRETLATYLHLARYSDIWHVSMLEPRPGNDFWQNWPGKHDADEYRKFGKANVLLSSRGWFDYLLYRLMCGGYFLSPRRLARAFLSRDRITRYNYQLHYRVAWRVLGAEARRVYENWFGRHAEEEDQACG